MSELEEFLRRLAERAAGREEDEDDEIIDAEIVESVEPRAAEVVYAEPALRRQDQLVADPGRPVHMADDRMDAHLQDAFGHQLGGLGARSAEPAASTLDDRTSRRPGPRSQNPVINLLRSPVTLRHLIVVREILDRPVHRW